MIHNTAIKAYGAVIAIIAAEFHGNTVLLEGLLSRVVLLPVLAPISEVFLFVCFGCFYFILSLFFTHSVFLSGLPNTPCTLRNPDFSLEFIFRAHIHNDKPW